jgi:hypothetical protein
MCIYIYIYVYIFRLIYIYIYIYIYICIYICIYIYVDLCIYIYVHIYLYIYIYIYISDVMTPIQQSIAVKRIYLERPVLFSILRDDGQRCCFKCPGKCLSICVCFACCQDGAHVYRDGIEDPGGEYKGRPYIVKPENLIGSILQVFILLLYIYIYVCMYICIYIYMYIFIFIYMYIHIFIYM